MSSSAGSTMTPGNGSEAPVATKTTVVIGNLKRDVDKEALNTLLCQLGRVTNFRLQQPPGVDPASPATGIVEYASAEDAGRVVAHVHGKLILGRPVTAWVPVPGGSPPPLPQGPPVPNVAGPNSTPAPGDPARAAYLGDMKNGARYPKPMVQMGGHEDARWERPPPPQQGQGQRGPPPPGAYGDGYPRNQRQQQQQQQQPWHPAGRPAPPPQQQGGPAGAAAGAAGAASRFRGEGDPAAHYGERQWQDQGHDEQDESGGWERPDRHHYPPHAHRAPPMRREHPAAYHRPPPPGPAHESGWYDEADSRGGGGSVPAHAAYGDSGGQLRGPPSRGVMPPRGSDDGYGEEGIPAGKRRRPPPPGGAAARGGMLPPGRGAAAAAAGWTEDAEYTVPPSAISIKGEDFEKEVVKAAALLVAEREMRAREEARNMGKTQGWPDGEPPPEDEGGHADGKRESGSKARSGGAGSSRSAGEEGKSQRKRQESSSSRGRAGGGGKYPDDKGDDNNRPKKKRSRHDDGGGGGSSPHGNGRAESRGDDHRHSSNGKSSPAEGPSSKGKPKAREESRAIHHPADDRDRGRDRDSRPREDSRGRYKDRDSRSRDKGGRSSRSRPSARPGSSGWDQDRGGDGGSPRGGGGGRPPYEHSTADTGFFVHVAGLSFSTTFTTLAKRFAAFGDVNGFKVIFNKVSCSAAKTGKRRGSKDETAKAAVVTASSGFAFISFDDERGMEKAVECMDGQELDGHILKVTRGKYATRSKSVAASSRSQTRPPSSAQRAPHRRPEPRGNQEHDQQQARKVHKPQTRPERVGDRRHAPISSAGSAAAPSSFKRDAQGSRDGGGGGDRAGGGGGSGSRGGGRNGGEKNRDPSPDPLGALRSPRPTTTSRKDAPVAKLEVNGRVKIGYGGGKPGGRDNGGGDDTASPPRRVVRLYNTSSDSRASNALSSSVRRVEQRVAAGPADPAGSDFFTSRFRRP
eukprot:g3784.t1